MRTAPDARGKRQIPLFPTSAAAICSIVLALVVVSLPSSARRTCAATRLGGGGVWLSPRRVVGYRSPIVRGAVTVGAWSL